MATAPCTAFTVINVDKIFSGGVNPDEYFSRLGTRLGSTRNFEDLRSPVDRTWIAFIPYFFQRKSVILSLGKGTAFGILRTSVSCHPGTPRFKNLGIDVHRHFFKMDDLSDSTTDGNYPSMGRCFSQSAVTTGEDVRYHP